ncbi:MAG: hypothetical protein ACP5G4_06235 [bacterium]
MGKIDYNQGEIHIVLETSDNTLVSEFEKIYGLIKGGTALSKKAEKIAKEAPKQAAEESPKPTTDVTFGKYLTNFKKLTKPEMILAFGEWMGKPFSSKDYFAVEKDRGAFTANTKKGFHPRLTGLKKADKIKTVKKGIYQITKQGKETLDKKRK